MSIKINIYILKKNEESLVDTITQELNIKMLDLKNILLQKYFPENNYLEINNITDRVYKDYGLLFFDKGKLPDTNDNYFLSKFTIPDRTFSFLINGKTIEKTITTLNPQKSNINQNKSFNFNKYKERNPNEPQPFVFNEEDFPALS
jgi:hypothetical protein